MSTIRNIFSDSILLVQEMTETACDWLVQENQAKLALSFASAELVLVQYGAQGSPIQPQTTETFFGLSVKFASRKRVNTARRCLTCAFQVSLKLIILSKYVPE